MKKAIVTLNIGEKYQTLWNGFCRKGWETYCARHGFDMINLEEPLDTSERANRRSPAWQKLLILSQDWSQSYERLVWVDSDIVVNPAAPSIVADVPEEKIGCTDEFIYPALEIRKAAVLEKRAHDRDVDAALFHSCVGLPAHSHIVQSGVMVLSPRYHREVFEHTYRTYEDAGPGHFYEMRFLSHEVQKAGLQHWIDPRFNALLVWLAIADLMKTGREPTTNFLREIYFQNFFLHFAGHQNLMRFANFKDR